MSVYIELVIFNNLAVDLALIAVVQCVRRRRLYKLRAVLGATVGAVCATYYAIAPDVVKIVIKLLLAPLMTLIFDKYDGKRLREKCKDYAKSLTLFVICSFFVGGIVYGSSFALGIDVSSYAVLGIIALSVFVVILIARYVVKLKGRDGKKVRDAVISYNGKDICVKGLCDSGNLLIDDLSGLPIVIISADAEKMLGDVQIEGYVNVNTVGGETDMPIVRLDKVNVGKYGCTAYGALAKKNFGDFEIILQNSMF